MSRCPDARALLPAYVEGELTVTDAGRVARHLAICAECRREEAHYRMALRTLRTPAPVGAPRDLASGLYAKLALAERRDRQISFQLRLAGAAACVLLAAGVLASPLRSMFLGRVESPASGPAVKRLAAAPVDRQVIHSTAPNRSMVASAASSGAAQREGAGSADVPAAKVSAQPGPRPAPAVHGRRSQTVRTVPAAKHAGPPSFLDVRPKYGRPAREQIADSRHSASGADRNSPAEPRTAPSDSGASGAIKEPSVRDGAVARGLKLMIPVRNERVQVGSSVTEIRTAYLPGRGGEPISVRVDIQTTRAPEEVER